MEIRHKLPLTFSIIIVGSVVLLVAVLSVLSRDYLHDYMTKTLRQEARTLSRELQYFPKDNLRQHLYTYSRIMSREVDARVTFIDSTGLVIADSQVDSAMLDTLENHYDRPEVAEARRSGWGTNQRTSATVQEPFLYVAIAVNQPQSAIEYVRLAKPLGEVQSTIAHLRSLLIFGGAGVLLIAVIVSWLVGQRLTKPIEEMSQTAHAIADGDYAARTQISGNDELGQLGDALNKMASTIESDIQQMRKLERMRTEFIGNTSHELKTPIASIRGYIETLLAGGIEDSTVNKKFLENALHNTDRLQALVQDLIQISRIESGEMRMSIRYFNIISLLNEVYADFQYQFEEQGLMLSRDFPEETSMKVQADRSRIKQVLTNLMTNSLKYTDEGGVTLGIEQDNDNVIIYVQDTGAGIPPEYQSRIFERFYRVDKDRSREVGGTGLGLAIVKHILAAHHSTIHVESDGHTGSKFWFSLQSN